MPRVEVGSVIEYKYRNDIPRPYDGQFRFPRFYFQDPNFDAPFLISQYVIIAPADFPLKIGQRNLQLAPTIKQIADLKVYTWTVTNSERLEPESHMPHINEILPYVMVAESRDWNDIHRIYQEYFLRRCISTELIRQQAKKLISSGPSGKNVGEGLARTERSECVPSLREKVEALYYFVNQEIKEEGGGRTAQDILLTKKGNRLILLKALLDAAGIESHFVLVRASPRLVPEPEWEIPRPEYFTGEGSAGILLQIPLSDTTFPSDTESFPRPRTGSSLDPEGSRDENPEGRDDPSDAEHPQDAKQNPGGAGRGCPSVPKGRRDPVRGFSRGGRTCYLSGNHRYLICGDLPPAMQGGTGFLVGRETGKIIPIPQLPHESQSSSTEMNFLVGDVPRKHSGSRKPTEVSGVIIFRGLANAQSKETFSMMDEKTRMLTLERGLNNQFPGLKLNKALFHNLRQFRQPLRLEFSFSLPHFITKGLIPSTRNSTLSGLTPSPESIRGGYNCKLGLTPLNLTRTFISERVRKLPLQIAQNFYSHDKVRIILPGDLHPKKLPGSVNLATSFGTYSLTVSTPANRPTGQPAIKPTGKQIITLERIVWLPAQKILPEQYHDFIKFCKKIDQTESGRIELQLK